MDPQLNKTTRKSLWKERHSVVWSFFCPLCRSSRRVGYQPRPSSRHFAQIGLTAAVFTCLSWPWFGIKGLVSFLPLWTVFEVIYRTRVRRALCCPHCGFDPYLYLIDRGRAKGEVEVYWRKKFEEKGIPYPEKIDHTTSQGRASRPLPPQ